MTAAETTYETANTKFENVKNSEIGYNGIYNVYGEEAQLAYETAVDAITARKFEEAMAALNDSLTCEDAVTLYGYAKRYVVAEKAWGEAYDTVIIARKTARKTAKTISAPVAKDSYKYNGYIRFETLGRKYPSAYGTVQRIDDNETAPAGLKQKSNGYTYYIDEGNRYVTGALKDLVAYCQASS